jgi:inner membrane protein
VDSLTHTLTAVAISHAGLNRKTRFATLTVVLGANLPDIDWVTRLDSSATCLKYHRGVTHSILGVTILALLLAWAAWTLARKARPKPGLPLAGRWLLLAAWLGTASHLLLDFTNPYGVRLFLPFSGRWYSWDIMFIFDPLLLALLIVGLGLPMILRLASEEVGISPSADGPRWGAVFSLCALVSFWAIRDFAHRRVLAQLDAHTYSNQNPQRLGAFPAPANPFTWTGVVETDSGYYVLPADALGEDVDPESARLFHKPEPSPALDAALKTRTARIFMDFARFPWAQVEESDQGFNVSIRDLRFISVPQAPGRGRGFVVEVKLDKALHPRFESFSFSAPER